MMRKVVIAAALTLLLGCTQAMAWNSVGHMAVAWTAYQQLTPVEQARAAALLKLNPNYQKWLGYIPAGTADADRDLYVFMMAATWPDEIKAMGSGYTGNDNPPKGELAALNRGYADKNMHKYWHFVNTPFSTDGTPLPAVKGPTTVDKIAAFRAALASAEPDDLKSYDLVWLLHLVGDVHQPLHASNRITAAKHNGDDGGNLVVISGPAKELHAYWDDQLGLGDTKNFLTALAAAKALPAPDATLAQDDNESHWAAESFELAKSSVYVDPIGAGLGPYTPTDAYAAQAKAIAQARVALAGARLARLLKESLACDAQACAH
ncbi:MAG: S1/P1 nuclease [Terracidiphilus sp.]